MSSFPKRPENVRSELALGCFTTMRLFWCQQLPLLLIIQLLEPSRSNQKIYAEALHAFKSAVGSPQQFSCWVGRYPCLIPWAHVSCHKLKGPGVVSLLPGSRPLSPQSGVINFSPCASNLSPSQASTRLRAGFNKSRKTRIETTVGGDTGVPTLTPTQVAHVKKPRKQLAAIVGVGVGAALLVVFIVALVYICLMRAKRFARRTSETASSVPSPPGIGLGSFISFVDWVTCASFLLVDWERENGSPHVGALSRYDTQNLRQLTIVELEHATCNFIESNVIGEGGFGLVYKGMLQDGSFVAIKRRVHEPSQYFLQEVKNIVRVRHKHIVKLIDSEGLPIGKLDMRQRLSIALGAAKGLEHLHSMVPPLLHMHFRTRNVLVDENFIAKVSDFGLLKLLVESDCSGSSSAIDCFLDPELRLSNEFSERSDVYSFGVFLLELGSGREALGRNQSEPHQNIVLQAKGMPGLDAFVDKTLGENTRDTVRWMMELALQCVDSSVQRPIMKSVVRELELIQVREMGHRPTGLGQEIDVFTLGSELFK
ncbi:hypothetical protein HHK36_016605 [Tetracentron sinense]|uniref:non-specific serine/threonine protein kinase n=1 Tax=Tetracentron sinense TaxID=13715 RepID=A0A835DEU3_TETSI|nr:hypothetical protein HHK36_016605 [Tetracentron sinense]